VKAERGGAKSGARSRRRSAGKKKH
jgi:hypothetical protein